MFRVECFVDDNKLVRVLKSLDGLCYDLKAMPVQSESQQNGDQKRLPRGQALPTGTAFLQSFLLLKTKHGQSTFRASEVIEAGTEAGISRATIYKSLTDLAAAKKVRRLSVGYYQIPMEE